MDDRCLNDFFLQNLTPSEGIHVRRIVSLWFTRGLCTQTVQNDAGGMRIDNL